MVGYNPNPDGQGQAMNSDTQVLARRPAGVQVAYEGFVWFGGW